MPLSKPMSLWLAPALILALGVLALLFDPFGSAPAGAATGVLDIMVPGITQGLARPAWIHLVEAVLLACPGVVLVFLLQQGLGRAAGFVAAMVLLFFCAAAALAWNGLLLDAAIPAATLVLAFAAGALAFLHGQYVVRAGLRLAFADSLPRAAIEKIARQPALLAGGGEARTVTCLACGVQGLAELAACCRDDPTAFVKLVQEIQAPLIDQVLAHGGTIDRLTAEGFTAFWNAPLDDPQHALHACEAAQDMSAIAARFMELVAQEAGREGIAVPRLEIGVGLASGPVIAGGFGGHGRMGYSVSGEPAVLARRIQALSHQYGPPVIAAGETRALADRDFAWLEVDSVAAGTRDRPVTLYAITGNLAMRGSPKFRALSVFHDHIFQAIRKQQWGLARDLIARCRRLSGASQKMYDLYLSRIAGYEKQPPGEKWDGAFRALPE